jgi:ribA/ribD-fused uncharacterized protein
LRGIRWPTLQHYYEAERFSITPDISHKIAAIPDVARLTEFVRVHCANELSRAGWEETKEQAMFDGLLQRFKQHPVLARLLLSTKDLPILYFTHELFWGVGANEFGHNRYGLMLERIRSHLRSAEGTSGSFLLPR